MVMRVRGLFAFGALGVLGLACYSGLSSLEPFPCASDGTCPNGLLCINDQCVCPTMCGQTCVNTSNDANNC